MAIHNATKDSGYYMPCQRVFRKGVYMVNFVNIREVVVISPETSMEQMERGQRGLRVTL
jgi:hypothetical protein